MILVLCEPEDTCGLWLAAEFARRGCKVDLVMPDELAVSSRLSLVISKERDRATIHLADGRIIDGDSLAGVINRMERFPRPLLSSASDRDVIYASEEIRAATVAWFAALNCPVLNAPTPYSALGVSASDVFWRHRAEVLGIRAASITLGVEHVVDQQADLSVVVIGETVLAVRDKPVPTSILKASVDLVHATGYNLLGLEFSASAPEEWEFLRTHMMPNLMEFGPKVIDAILAVMEYK